MPRITIIVIAIALTAIVESFIVGSASSVNISNQQTAQNIAKQTMAELYYCRYGGTGGVCTAFNATWESATNITLTFSQGPTDINNECFYTQGVGNWAILERTAPGYFEYKGISTTPTKFIRAKITTEWYLPSAGAPPCPTPTVSYPSVVLRTIFAEY